jgi:SAM-dependent methyltransferase
MFLYALTIFMGAFLVFQVQPLIAKYILPWFGGGPGIWTTCMLFFQVALLGGYTYAHLSSRWLKPRWQAVVHMVLLGVAVTLLPITPGDGWKPRDADNPVGHILALLAVNIGLPYVVLSSTAPLMQRWFTRTHPGASPYRLYALSNVGSLLALLSYPFYFETHFTRKTQAWLWGCGLALYAVCGALCAVKLWRTIDGPAAATRTPEPAEPALAQKALWLLLPACASVLLLAITNKLCRDMLVMPFLWVLPLALYLLTFIICFDSPRWYARPPFALMLAAALGGICWTIFHGEHWPIWGLVSAYCGVLFICCMVCHGEVYRLRPGPAHLTEFYLMIAAGGALGGVFVAVVAPMIFPGYYELHVGVLLCGILFLIVCALEREGGSAQGWRWMAWLLPLVIFGGFDWLLSRVWVSEVDLRDYLTGARVAAWTGLVLVAGGCWIYRAKFKRIQAWQGLSCLWLGCGVLALSVSLWFTRERSIQKILDTSRNFYGRLRVFENYPDVPERHLLGLLHERVNHGWQFVDPVQAKWPTLYFGEHSGVGMAMRALPPKNRRIGVVGLGIGTVTAYARPGDYVRIYEINPEAERLARLRFTYLTNCQGKADVVLGDGRLSLERDEPQQFDLLALDAFNGAAPPIHLLTKEAFELYERHLKPNGVIAIDISNRYLDFAPVLCNVARNLHYRMAVIYDKGDPARWWDQPSDWVLLTRNEQLLDSPAIREATSPQESRSDLPLWTDDFASLFQILKSSHADAAQAN